MSFSDPIGDMLTRIRNGQLRKRSTVRAPLSKLRCWVLDVLKREGYIRGYQVISPENCHSEIEISLKYARGSPAIVELKRISKPGRRVYTSVRDLPYVRQGLGVAIVSTSRGIMSDADARESKLGGEILCTVF